ncbi:MAG TPA: ATP-dependent DNA helicase, partial [Dermatophilaceae bacterium]|nr:ATP-dependent DNA helicase [Dermatophilaceae bacterium]
ASSGDSDCDSSCDSSPERNRGGGRDARVLPLSTSWRNDRSILDAANAVATPLREAARVHVLELSPAPRAGAGWVGAARLSTVEEEADLVAAWVEGQRSGGERSAAILCRKRSQFAPVIDALERRGVPYEVVGLGGLLVTPEIEDIVALLHVVQDPARGDQLMRLLTGPLCRLGAADLDGFMAWARYQQEVRAQAESPQGAPQPFSDAVDRPSIVEALDDLPPVHWRSRDGRRVSEAGRERLGGLQRVVRRLRALTALPLADLVGEAERALGLDIEVLSRPGYTPAAARAHLDAFADVAASFTVSADRPTLGGFLSWLTAALKEERGLDKGYIEASADAVQVLTVHAAKGLEWDAVAVPGLVEGSFPDLPYAVSKPRGGAWVVTEPKDRGWAAGLKDGGIPYALRGDRDGLPVLDWEGAADWADMEGRVAGFLKAGGAHGVAEERRLAYVALTRARTAMLLTAPIWADATTPRVTSRFLTELLGASTPGDVPTPGEASVEVLEWAPMPDPDDLGAIVNPRTLTPQTAVWPHDPMAGRRRSLETAAAEVRSVLEAGDLPPAPAQQGTLPLPGETLPLLEELDLLLAERRLARQRSDEQVIVPRHLSTSAVVSLAQDPEAFAAALRRPMPAAPALAARRGTAFHAWIEQHYRRAAMVDMLELPGSADDDPGDDAALPAMKERFLCSEWAGRIPLEVETAVETVVDGIAIRGRIDAVFPGDGGNGFTVVDWKTGDKPTGEVARARTIQLAAYRLAYARLRGVPVDEVQAAFYYAGSGETVFPVLPDEQEIVAILRGIAP